ncbi:MAG: hypothetical protein J6Y18_03845 [Candidatus Methanomethylophilaceae archaeon]|nr:hypothetical protein [Candidatus Methanomethylophilaceae archaeon]
MMEFTLARVSACVCGAMLILILFNPVTDSYEDRAETGCSDNCTALGDMFDSFMASQTDESTVALNIMLPDSGSSLTFNGKIMKISGERGEWDYVLRNETDTDKDSYSGNDLIQLTKSGDVLVIRAL